MERREALVGASLQLFTQEGIKAVSMGRLSQALGVSTKTLYQLFGDKRGLVAACLQRYLAEGNRLYAALAADVEDAAELILRYYQRQIERLLRIHPGFLREAAHYLPSDQQRRDFLGEDLSREMLAQGQAQGLFQPGVAIPIAASTLALLLESIFEGQRFAGHGTRELMTQVLWPYLRGLCTQSGLEAFRHYRERYLK